ncbi:MAG: DUF4956 domain-containing protein [Kiritimatiellae bacterium]|nr:DUF4956 domain-containing protein [Kiritimatiellia bacterium]
MNEATTPSPQRIDSALAALQRIREQIDVGEFLSALLAALLAAFAAQLLYRFFYERRGTGSRIHRAFPLLALAVTTLFIGVQVSLPLSLGLLGSLSIVRFRTPVKEPEEVGFVMLVIASSICAATLNFAFIVWLYAFALVALLAMRGAALSRWIRRDGLLVLSLPDAEADGRAAELGKVLDSLFRGLRIESTSSRDGTTTWQYAVTGVGGGAEDVVRAIRAVAPSASVNLFLDRPGGIR